MRSNFASFFPAQSVAAKLAIVLVAGSLLIGVSKGTAAPAMLLLTPELFLSHLMLWQPLSYAFVEVAPLGVIFGALMIWSLGSALEMGWGSRRMGIFAVAVTALAGLCSALLALLIPVLRGATWTGGTVMASALWVAYGWSYGRRTTNFWGLPVTGNVFAGIGILFVVLNALQSWPRVIPDAFALVLTFLYVRFGSPHRMFGRIRSAWDRMRLRSRSRHLKVISKNRNIGGGSDRFLH